MHTFRKLQEEILHGNSFIPPDFNASVDKVYPEENMLNLLHPSLRIFVATVLSVFMIIGIIMNTAAVIFCFKRKYTHVSKCLFISLSLSDWLMALDNGVINAVKALQKYKNNWVLGPIMCHLGPYVQVLGLLVNSFTLTCIALDRYIAVVNAVSSRWTPSQRASRIIILLLWVFCSLITIPMAIIYSHVKVYIINTKAENATFIPIYMCIINDPTMKDYYFIIVFSFLFVPVLLACLGLYTTIAIFIWRRRKPGSAPITIPRSSQGKKDGKSQTSNYTTSSTQGTNLSLESIQNAENSNISQSNTKNMTKTKSLHSQKKVRSFKIILSLMAIFFICRLPSWILNLINIKYELQGEYEWLLPHIFSILSVINSAINPFLYCFLKEIFNVYKTIKNKFTSCFMGCCRFQVTVLKRNGETLQIRNRQKLHSDIAALENHDDFPSRSMEAVSPYICDLEAIRKKTGPLEEKCFFRKSN